MIELSLELKGDEILIAASKKFRAALPKTAANAARRVLRRRITTIKKRIRAESGIGRSIWGSKGGGLDKLVTLIRPTGTEDTLSTGVKLKGLPRMIEEGGQTKPHVIKAKNAPRLAFVVGGHPVFVKQVDHKRGSVIRPHGIAAAEMKAAQYDLAREVNESIAKLKASLFSQAA